MNNVHFMLYEVSTKMKLKNDNYVQNIKYEFFKYLIFCKK